MVKASQGLRIGSKPLKIKEGAPQKCGVLFIKNYEKEKVKMMNLNDYLNGKVVPICDECKKELSPDELGYGHDCEGE